MKLDQSSHEATYQLPRQLFQSGRALKRLRRGLGNAPHAGCLWELYGVIQHARRQFSKAVGALETATMLRPLSLGGQLALADCFSSLAPIERRIRYCSLWRVRQICHGITCPTWCAGWQR